MELRRFRLTVQVRPVSRAGGSSFEKFADHLRFMFASNASSNSLPNAKPSGHKHVLHASGVSLLTVALRQQLWSQDPAQSPFPIVAAFKVHDSAHLKGHQCPILLQPEQRGEQSA